VSAPLRRRVERLERRCPPVSERVRHVWWDRRDPYPEAAPGERLVVTCWMGDEDDAAPPSLPEAKPAPEDGR
jgi:hypothetical protein